MDGHTNLKFTCDGINNKRVLITLGLSKICIKQCKDIYGKCMEWHALKLAAWTTLCGVMFGSCLLQVLK